MPNDAVTGVQLPPMAFDEPAWLGFMIARYLDDEWIEQEVHHRIGDATGRIYKESRAAGDNDLIAVLAKMTFGLKDMWADTDFSEAFEGPVDVANRAAEFLMLRLGREVLAYGRSNEEVQERLMLRARQFEMLRKSVAQ